MAKEGNEGTEVVSILFHRDTAGIIRCRPYGTDLSGWVTAVSKLPTDLSAMQPRQRGLNGRRVHFPSFVLERIRGVRPQVSNSKA